VGVQRLPGAAKVALSGRSSVTLNSCGRLCQTA
jgi:hypothetical protein